MKCQAGWITIWNQDCWERKTEQEKVSGKNINYLRYEDNTTLTAESEEELKSLLMRVKESEKAGLKLKN